MFMKCQEFITKGMMIYETLENVNAQKIYPNAWKLLHFQKSELHKCNLRNGN